MGCAAVVVGVAWIVLAGGGWVGHRGVAEDAHTRTGRGGPRERLTVREGVGDRVVEGVIVTEALDGGLLVERADQRYEVVQPESIVTRCPAAAEEPEAPRDLGRRVLAELPAGFEVHLTRHYVVCFDTPRDYAKWCAAMFERLHEAFANYWRQAGLELATAERPLVVVIFAERGRYDALATREVGPAGDGIVGYYSLVTNRVTTFDITGSAGRRAAGRARRPPGPEILASPEAAGLVATLVHEATHQLAFNSGLHRRLAPVPLWVSEGIASYFETPDLESARGWRGIGLVNRPRLERFRRSHAVGDLEPLLRGDERFRRADEAADAYAAAWALTAYLLDTRKPQFVAYMKLLAAKPPLGEDGPELRLREFTAAFGPPAEIDEALVRYCGRLAAAVP